MDRETYSLWIAAMCSRWRDNLSEGTIRVWYDVLSDIPAAEFVAACDFLIRHSEGTTRVPDPTEIRRAVMDQLAARGLFPPDGSSAWATFLSHFRLESLEPPGPAAIRAIGGPRLIAMAEEDQLPFFRRDFTKAYETLRLRMLPERLLTLQEGDNDEAVCVLPASVVHTGVAIDPRLVNLPD